MIVSCGHKSKKKILITDVSQYFYRETFCYLDNIPKKVCFIATDLVAEICQPLVLAAD